MSEIQTGEILRRVENIERKMERLTDSKEFTNKSNALTKEIDDLEKRLSDLELRLAGDAVVQESMKTRIGSIEETLKWIVRLVVGAVILALLGTTMGGGGIGPGR